MDSAIIPTAAPLFNLIGFRVDQKLNLLYRASTDGWASSNFHNKCNGKANTLTIIKTVNGNVFGGFTAVPWSNSNLGWRNDERAFIFSLVNNQNRPTVFPVSSTVNAIYDNYSYGPTFGGGHDIHIVTNSYANENSYSNLGHSYSNNLHAYGSAAAQSFLAGSYRFRVAEIEVFQLQ